MKKILFLILSLVTAISLFTLCAFASTEEAFEDIAYEYANAEYESEHSTEGSGEDIAYEYANAEEADKDSAEDADENESASADEYSNPMEELYSLVINNSDKLLSALSFVGTLIIMLVYKKGLLPILRGGVGAITKGVGEVQSESKRQSEEASAMHSLISSKLAATEGAVERIEETVGVLEARCAKAAIDAKTSNAVYGAMEIQSELLYEILLASALPNYEKERIGQRISEIKAILHDGGCAGDEAL